MNMTRPSAAPTTTAAALPRRACLAALILGCACSINAAQTASSPITITSDDETVFVVNPDNDSVSVINVAGDANTKTAEITVGDEPRFLAITPDDSKLYVANMASGTVSVIDVAALNVTKTIKVGAEPFGCAVTPDGSELWVANLSSGNISIIDTDEDRVIRTIGRVGQQPAAIAFYEDKAYVTLFLAQLRDDSRSVEEKEGR